MFIYIFYLVSYLWVDVMIFCFGFDKMYLINYSWDDPSWQVKERGLYRSHYLEGVAAMDRLRQMREGVQSSSNSNHRHPNLFCGKRAPQLVISTTSISINHRKILLFSVIWI